MHNGKFGYDGRRKRAAEAAVGAMVDALGRVDGDAPVPAVGAAEVSLRCPERPVPAPRLTTGASSTQALPRDDREQRSQAGKAKEDENPTLVARPR